MWYYNKNDNVLKESDKMEMILHYIMSYIGGFLGVYTILLRGGNFGSAQTANLINLATGWFDTSWTEMAVRIAALAIFIFSMIAAYLLPKYVKCDIRRICIWVEIAGIFLAGFLPEDMNDIIALYPVFAVTAFQWGAFGGAGGYSSATIFSTNNLKQMVLAWTEYVRMKDAGQKEKALFYSGTLLSFQIGVLGGFFAVNAWSVKGIWACLLPLFLALALLEADSAKPYIRKKKVTGSNKLQY